MMTATVKSVTVEPIMESAEEFAAESAIAEVRGSQSFLEPTSGICRHDLHSKKLDDARHNFLETIDRTE